MPSELIQSSLQELRQQRNRQQEEMAQLDATLAADRLRRAAERSRLKDVQRVAVDINTRVAEVVLSATHAVMEAKLAETAVKEKELQAEIQKRLVKREGERERELVRRTAVRKREAERKSQLKGARSQNKKYVTQSAEFYGADFSKPPEDVEITALHKRRSDEHANIQTSEQVRLRGGVFIEAITRAAAQARRSSVDVFETTKSSEASSSEGEEAAKKTQHDPERGFTVQQPTLLKALAPPPLDYTDLFSPRVGKQSGIMVYRVENLRPVPQPGSAHGKFCVADCYIVLRTASALDDSGGLDWTIWQWCGPEASLDKRACSAIYAINLRNFLGAPSRIQHESHNEESSEFLQVFETPIEYLPATQGTESGLAKAARRRSPMRLYRIYGERSMKARLVAPEAKSLRTDGAFLLEQNRQIFVWFGKNASLQSKGKARLLADRLNSSERSGRAVIHSVDEGDEPEEMWDLLGDRPHVAIGNEEAKETEGTDNAAHEEARSREEYEFEQLALRFPTLYRVPEELKPSVKDHDISPGDGLPLRRSLLQTTGCYILDCGVELFLWIGREASTTMRDKATELLAQVVMQENRPRWLGLHKIFEYCEVEVFRMRFSDWMTSGGEVRTTKTVPVTTLEGFRVDVAALYSPRATVAIMEESDLESLMARANQLLVSMTSFVFVRGRFVRTTEESCNRLHDSGAFLFLCTYRLEEEGQGESPSPTKSPTPTTATTALSVNDRERNAAAMECVVYFWEGGRAPKASWPTFTLKSLSEIKTVAQKQWGAELKVVRVTPSREPVALLAHWKQELLIRRSIGEDATDAAGNAQISNADDVRKGTSRRPEESDAPELPPSTPITELYHIRTDPQYKATRGIQVVPAKASRLVSRDCFYVRRASTRDGKEEGYLWIGKGASKDETRRATQFVKDMFPENREEIKTILERSETPAFWSLLGGKDSPQPGSEFYYVKPPRFFRCEAATTGNYRIEELPSPVWGQRDLRENTCVILDPGAPEMCYMWVGAKASDVVVKLTKRAVEVYLDHCDDGRQFIGTPMSPSRNEPQISSPTKTEEQPSGNRGRFRARRERHRRSEGDVLMIYQGHEPEYFQAFFHGWDIKQAGGPIDDKDVGNVFSREEDKRKLRRHEERERKRRLEESEKLKRAGIRFKSLEELLTDKEKILLRMETKSRQGQLASEIEAAAKGRRSNQILQPGTVGTESHQVGNTSFDRNAVVSVESQTHVGDLRPSGLTDAAQAADRTNETENRQVHQTQTPLNGTDDPELSDANLDTENHDLDVASERRFSLAEGKESKGEETAKEAEHVNVNSGSSPATTAQVDITLPSETKNVEPQLSEVQNEERERQLSQEGHTGQNVPTSATVATEEELDVFDTTDNAEAPDHDAEETLLRIPQPEQKKDNVLKIMIYVEETVSKLPRPEELKVETQPRVQTKTKKTKKSLFSSSPNSPDEDKPDKEEKKQKRWFQR